jgi:DNA-binding transcriptional MerR regulator
MEDLTIGQVAAHTGLSVHTLRLYEREGLLHTEVRRDRAGRRRYARPDLDWLDVCTKFRASGMPLASIRRFAGLVREGPGNEADRLELLRAHQGAVQERMRELTECLTLIAGKVATYQEAVDRGTAATLWTG